MALPDHQQDVLDETSRLYVAARYEFDRLLNRGDARPNDFNSFFIVFQMRLTPN